MTPLTSLSVRRRLASPTGSAAAPANQHGLRRSLRNGVLPKCLLAMACLACLVPFSGKAFHIDDPLFLWTAERIRQDPSDFYGFGVNWYRTVMPMSRVTMNPPLTAYYLALVTAAFGEREVPVHLAFLVWPIGVVLGTYRLAVPLCRRPVLAALATLLTPVFLVSATNVMCDVMMLCFWVWAVVWWRRGLDEGMAMPLCIAGMLAALAFLTKYFGVALVPLLAAYAAFRHILPRQWLWALLIPLGVVAGYQWLTFDLYGEPLLAGAAGYAGHTRRVEFLGGFILGLTFTGGCAASLLWYAARLWPWRATLAGLCVSAGLIAVRLRVHPTTGQMGMGLLEVQLMLAVSGGLCLLGLVITEVGKWRDPDAILLVGWVAGTFVFAVFLNWTMNARSILPMVPAAGILVARQLDRRAPSARWWPWPGWPLVPALMLALAVATADYQMADSAATAARQLQEEFGRRRGGVWFEGHWGFQYYLQRLGGRAVDFEHFPRVWQQGALFLPRNSTYVLSLDPKQPFGIHERYIEGIKKVQFRACPWAATMHPAMHAGFYSCSQEEHLPFTFGPAPPEEYYVMVLRPR